MHSDVSREINEESVDAIKESTSKWNAEELQPTKIIETPFGTGTLVGKRVDSYDDKMVELLIVKLESGATLFGPVESKRLDDEIENKVASPVTEVAEGKNSFIQFLVTQASPSSPNLYYFHRYEKKPIIPRCKHFVKN